MEFATNVTSDEVINSLSDGVYVCDLDRQIVYWNESAARITGWKRDEVVGKHCFDNILCHVNKDGHQLCSNEFCPLHRAMVTGKISRISQLVYALGANGKRIPMEVTVAPIHDDRGKIVGGVETFRDASSVVRDLERAKAIQHAAMEHDVPDSSELVFKPHYISCDIVGGDYYAIKDLGGGHYGLILADVMGHGIAAALYTMHLSSLWNRYHPLLKDPVEFLNRVNRELSEVMKQGGVFATAVCGVVDVRQRRFRFAGAGGPSMVRFGSDGSHHTISSEGLPLGLLSDADYQESSCSFNPGERLLLFSDGAVEIENVNGSLLDSDGLIGILRGLDYPKSPLQMVSLEEALLRYSNAIRLEDDLTLIEIQFQK